MKNLFLAGMTILSFMFGMIGVANAAPIVGHMYYDTGNIAWEYIGFYNVADGPQATSGGLTYSGLEAAELVFGTLPAGIEYAISTDDTFVDHLAWYDGWGQTDYLNYTPGSVGLAEDINTDPGGDGFNDNYGWGDWSAYTNHHVSYTAGSDNYVFKSVVPEPTTMLLLGSGLIGLAGFRRRFRKS